MAGGLQRLPDEQFGSCSTADFIPQKIVCPRSGVFSSKIKNSTDDLAGKWHANRFVPGPLELSNPALRERPSRKIAKRLLDQVFMK